MIAESKGKSWRVTPPFLLFLVFLVLKLTGVITWSWWWVTAPLWAPVVLAVVVALVCVVLALIAVAKEEYADRKRQRSRP